MQYQSVHIEVYDCFYVQTVERAEVVDFVHPYFEQSGISIIMRDPVKPQQMFMFVDMLSQEVWLAVLASLIGTALTLWFLDR